MRITDTANVLVTLGYYRAHLIDMEKIGNPLDSHMVQACYDTNCPKTHYTLDCDGKGKGDVKETDLNHCFKEGQSIAWFGWRFTEE